MNNEPIKEVTSHKHLGIFFSNDGTWHQHIDYITSKAWTILKIMRRLKFILDRQSLDIIYTSFIRPVLEYADVVWDNCTQYEINALEKIQIEAARIAPGATKLVSLDILYWETGWESLEKRRHQHKLCLFFQMNTSVSPNYLSSLIPASVEDSTTYNLRNANHFRHTLSRTQLYNRSFLPSSIRAWNDLSLKVRQSNSIQSFKYQLNKNLKKPPKYYYISKRLSQIQHTILRTDCSSLNHLLKKNIVDSPHCACGAVETTKHYFFKCQRYNEIRTTMLNELANYCQPDLNIV